jgi:SAM-dependent methyltransferase
VLDVGCGDALFLPALEEFGRAEGIEVDASIVDPTGPYADRIHVGPFDTSFQPDRRYALITILDVLEHLSQPEESLRHALSLLRDDGLVLITVPAFRVLWTSHDDLNHHQTRYTKRTLARLSKVSGLEIIETRYFFHWTCPVKLAIRFKESFISSRPRPASVPNPALNWLCFALSRFEQIVLGRLPIPLGSSLLVVGKRSPYASSQGPSRSPFGDPDSGRRRT